MMTEVISTSSIGDCDSPGENCQHISPNINKDIKINCENRAEGELVEIKLQPEDNDKNSVKWDNTGREKSTIELVRSQTKELVRLQTEIVDKCVNSIQKEKKRLVDNLNKIKTRPNLTREAVEKLPKWNGQVIKWKNHLKKCIRETCVQSRQMKKKALSYVKDLKQNPTHKTRQGWCKCAHDFYEFIKKIINQWNALEESAGELTTEWSNIIKIEIKNQNILQNTFCIWLYWLL